jgi:hypothetical protein
VVLVVDWANLWAVALPLSLALTVSAVLGFLLTRSVGRSRGPGDEPDEGSPANELAPPPRVALPITLPLVIFVATATFAVFAYGFPGLLLRYVLPFNLGSSQVPSVLLSLLFIVNLGAALALAIYLVQGVPRARDGLARGAAGAALAGVVAGGVPGAIGAAARTATPIVLAALVLLLATEHRARLGGALFGIRTVGLSTFPLFFVSGLALARIAEVLQLAR